MSRPEPPSFVVGNALPPGGQRKRKARTAIDHGQYEAAHPQCTGNEATSVELVNLNADLKCPICLRLMRDPVATECLHRFCKDCIEKCQRQAQKQCPSCRKPIATRRSLRPDPNLAGLIKKLYPDLEAFEAEEDKAMEAQNAAAAKVHAQAFKKTWATHRARQNEREKAERQAEHAVRRQQQAAAARERRAAGAAQQHVGAARPEEPEGEGEATPAASEDEREAEPAEGEEELYDDADPTYLDDHYADEDYEEEKEEPAARQSKAAGKLASAAAARRKLAPRSYELGFRLIPHRLEDSGRMAPLEKAFITVSCLAQVQHVQKFLAKHNSLPDHTLIRLTIEAGSTTSLHSVLKPDMTLHDCVQHHRLDASKVAFAFLYQG